MRNVGCQTYTTISQSQQWAGLQSATPIQTERSDEGVKNRTENSLYLFMYKYWTLEVELSTVQNKKQRQFMTPLVILNIFYIYIYIYIYICLLYIKTYTLNIIEY